MPEHSTYKHIRSDVYKKRKNNFPTKFCFNVFAEDSDAFQPYRMFRAFAVGFVTHKDSAMAAKRKENVLVTDLTRVISTLRTMEERRKKNNITLIECNIPVKNGRRSEGLSIS